MRSRPFLIRWLIPVAATIALIVVVCGAVIYLAGQHAVRQQQVQDLDRLTSLVGQWLTGSSGDEITRAQHEQLRGAAEVLRTRITLIAGNGKVLFDSHSPAEVMDNHNARPEVVAARTRGVGTSMRRSATIAEDHVYVARLLDAANANGIVVRLSYPRTTWARPQVSVTAVLGAAIVLALLTLGAFAMMLHWRWIAPVRQLASAAKSMADGKWNTRVQPGVADDLREFSAKLNIVAEQAEKQLADLKEQRSDLQALVDTLPDPVIVADAQQRIALINIAAAELLDVSPQQVLGHNVAGAVNDAVILELFDQMAGRNGGRGAGGGSVLQREIRLLRNGGQRLTYQAVAAPTTAGGTLLVLRDVTALSSMVQMKTDFVANASHELRTPISAIKIAFETLRDVYREDAQQSDRCIQVIDGHLKRLEEMLQDLLDLSRVESDEIKPQLAVVRPDQLFQHVRATMGPMARQKGVELSLVSHANEDGASEFESDERLLNLILKNLVENSIKFTPAGGRVSVEFATDEGADAVVMQVGDTGIGIAAEHIDRVFERFYQADVARSSGAGRGTGLGLAIVKHAVAALGGAVRLESKLGAGTTVTCTFPRTASAIVN